MRLGGRRDGLEARQQLFPSLSCSWIRLESLLQIICPRLRSSRLRPPCLRLPRPRRRILLNLRRVIGRCSNDSHLHRCQ